MDSIIIFIIVCGYSAIASAVVAEAKGRSQIGWFIGGVFFGPLNLLAIVGMPTDEFALKKRRILAGLSKVCPSCAEAIRTPAYYCPYCHSPQPDQTAAEDEQV